MLGVGKTTPLFKKDKMKIVFLTIVCFLFLIGILVVISDAIEMQKAIAKKKSELNEPIDDELERERWQKALNNKYGQYAPIVYKNKKG